jgi:hypothetical protein
MTEKFCIVSLNSEQEKYKILNNPDDREILYCNSKQWTVIWIVENLVFCLFTVSSYNTGFLWHLDCWESCILPVHCLELQYLISLSSGLLRILYFACSLSRVTISTIQMTGKSCIVTLNSEQAKYKILNNPDDREILYCNSRQRTGKIQDSQQSRWQRLQYRISLSSGLLRILYFACSLIRVTIHDFSVILIVENLVFCLFTV